MTAQTRNTPDGYVVSVWADWDGHYTWHDVRNFGDRQGEAFEFRDDCKFLDEKWLRMVAKKYDKTVKWRCIRRGTYRREGAWLN